ncbi:MAG: hypothetical protein M3Y40_08365 [Chloroflexota bacterium]|nr:hypothetical protein [Chloroflexota bacterium]
MQRRQVAIGLGALVLVLIGIGAFAVLGERAGPLGRLEIPERGEVRPDYLSDETPVWVVGHEDGSVSVLSGFDTHRPSGIGKVLWWCGQADAFENPEHGAKYDEYGFYIGGPAPSGLPAYSATVEDGDVIVGELQTPPAQDERHVGPPEVDRDWCNEPDDERTWHTFDGWEAWDSPTAAVEAAPDGWILLEGRLALRDGAVVVCGSTGCNDAVVAANIDPTDAEREFGPLFGDRFIAQVHDGELVGVTRVTPSDITGPQSEPPAP